MNQLIKWTILLLISSMSYANNHCQFGEIKEENLSAPLLKEMIKGWKESGKEVSASDVICCLPKSWRSNFIVLPNSQSLQCSGKKFPRVILFDPSKESDSLKTAISFVGKINQDDYGCNSKFSGDNAYKSVEIMDFNAEASDSNKLFTFSHLNPKSGWILATRPKVCLDCHGTPNGWRPVSKNLSHASTHLGGYPLSRPSANLNCVTDQERQKQAEWMREFQELLKTNTQSAYHCLEGADQIIKEKSAEIFIKRNKTFIERLARAQNWLTVSSIKKIPAYSNYKKAFLSAALGCQSDSFLKSPFFSNYFSPSKTNKNNFFKDYIIGDLPNKVNSQVSYDHLGALICHNKQGICGSRIPKIAACQKSLAETAALVKTAEASHPKEYGYLLAETFYNLGRSASYSVDNVEKFARLSFLTQSLLTDSDLKAKYSSLFDDYPGPNAIDFNHFSQLLAKEDPELSHFLPLIEAKDHKQLCLQLKNKN